MSDAISWVGVDWGTSNARAYAMTSNGAVAGTRALPKGMNSLTSQDYPVVLEELIDSWRRPADASLKVLICGMAGSRQGWREAPYADVATPASHWVQHCLEIDDAPDGIQVFLLPGLKQMSPSANVMRGEETQLRGLISQLPGYHGAVCMPGTHCKWVQVADGEITGFTTAMTGELFDLLSTRSILRFSVTEPDEANDGSDHAGFAEAVSLIFDRPARLSGELFAIRAGSLLNNYSAIFSRNYLSGLLIGAELAAIFTEGVPNRPVPIVASASLAARYQRALEAIGAKADIQQGDGLVVAGLTLMYNDLNKEIQSR